MPFVIAVGLAAIWVMDQAATVSVTVPPGTSVKVRLDQALASDQSRPGDQFKATLIDAVRVNGKVAIPEGAQIEGKVVDANAPGGLQRTAQLRLTLDSIKADGITYELHTTDVTQYGSGHNRLNAGFVVGAGGGTLVDAVAGGAEEARIRAAAGDGIGSVAITGRKNVRMPAETPLEFRLIEPLVVQSKS
ncbi:MAG: hypothetical protein M1404_00180 [Acidobacteria bacterium]|nr:hypothetical protein [Acidobacteriota bacterium]